MSGLSLNPELLHIQISQKERQLRSRRRRRTLKYVLAHAIEDLVWRLRYVLALAGLAGLLAGAVVVAVGLQREAKNREHLKGIESHYARLIQEIDQRVKQAEGRVAVVSPSRVKMSSVLEQGEASTRVGYYLQNKTEDERDLLSIGRMEILPGKTSHTPATNPDDMVMFVEAGRGVVIYLEDARPLEPGSAVHFASGTRVAINNVGNEPLKLHFVRWSSQEKEGAGGNPSVSEARPTGPGRFASIRTRPEDERAR